MLKQLKQFLGWRRQPTARPQASATVAAPRTGSTPANPRSGSSRPARQSRPLAARPLAARPVAPAPASTEEDVSIPLQSVLDALPLELKCAVVPLDVRGATLTVALHKVLPQLPQGPVKLCFGDIRRAAPSLFSIGAESDEHEVDLPLNELLSRVNPALLQPSPSSPADVHTDAIESSFNQSAPPPVEDSVPEFEARGIFTKPGGGPLRVPLPARDEAPEWVAAAPLSALAVEAEMMPEPFAVKARAPQPVEAPNPTATEELSLTIPLATLAAHWPPLVRAEIEQLDCASAQVALPESLVQAGLKQGKVEFPWQTLREWLMPTPPPVISKQDSTPLELPLEVLMPVFLARWKQTPKTQSKLVVDETIPALFSAAAPADPATPSAATSNTATPAANAAAPAAKTPGTDFKNRYISPTEVVARASALSGVAGAMVVLPEGLVVASKLSGGQNPDALAAFLAQAMSRIVQFTKEAEVGELSRLTFWANEVQWLVFRLNGIFVVAFGWAGGELPTAELAVLAAEFERKHKN